jgi:hypothetical protein
MWPHHEYAFQELKCEDDEDHFERIKTVLNGRDLDELTPADGEEARAVLLGIIDKAIERLRMIEAKRQKVADLLARLQPNILGFDDSKGGEQLRRHMESENRVLIRNVEAIQRAHRHEAAGWGRTRQERQRRKQEREGPASQGEVVTNQGDRRFVVDGRGKIRPAEGYEGNLSEGLARFEVRIGRQPIDLPHAPRDRNPNNIPRIPDFARWTPPKEEETPNVGGGRKHPAIESDADLPDWARGDSDYDLVTSGLAAEGDRTKKQNENSSVASCPLSVPRRVTSRCCQCVRLPAPKSVRRSNSSRRRLAVKGTVGSETRTERKG